jgi:predicted DNA binding CopG/RHH family protein
MQSVMAKYQRDRTEFIQVRLSSPMKEAIREASQAQGLTMTAWLEQLAQEALRRTRKTGRTDRR